MTERDRPGSYNPFEDTGDWPFRESAPPPVEPSQPSEVPFDREENEPGPEPEPDPDPLFRVDERQPEAAVEPEPESEPEPLVPPQPEPEPEPGPEPESEPQAAVPAEVDADEEEPFEPVPMPVPDPEPDDPLPPAAEASEPLGEHAAGSLEIPEGHEVLEGAPNGFRRTVAVVVSRFNADVTSRLLESALDALTDAHVTKESITIVPVPGAFELPLAAMALAKTRRFSCVVALGCVIRGETPHFDFVAGEAASGLQLAAIETGVPVSFGLLTCETKAQAEARVGRGADAARAALEMADLFTQVRTRASRSG
jgi:6,7-dimethyl-8-ribityllumazine synthase